MLNTFFKRIAHCGTPMIALLLAGSGFAQSAQPNLAPDITPDHALKVMSFNIRYDNPNDGPNAWPHRTGLVLDVVRDVAPDVMGCQEVLQHMGDVLQTNLPDYTFVGVGRNDGDTQGEYAPILFRTDRFTLLASGYFWLSQTPNTPGSVSWDAALTRMATWVMLRDLQTGHVLAVINTHFDHRGEDARYQSIGVIQTFASELMTSSYAPDGLVLLGDLNATADSPPIQRVLADDAQPFTLTDTLAAVNQAGPDATTFNGNGFSGGDTSYRIDYVFTSPTLTVHDASINKLRGDDGQRPSDHDAVWAVVTVE